MQGGLLAWGCYAAATGALVILAAEAVDRAARMGRWPTRYVWVTAVVAMIAVLVCGANRLPTPVASSPHGDGAGQVWFLFLWCGVSIALLARLVASFVSAHQRIARLPVLDLDGVTVRMSDALGPAVVGLVYPCIVVPWWVLALPKSDRRLVMLHEQEHRQAGDQVLAALGELALVLVPWHVAIWYVVRRLRRAIELDCDARVLRQESDVERYGRLLLRCAHAGEFATPLMSWMRGPAGTLELRIRAMTAPPPMRYLRPACLYAATVCAALAGMGVLERPAPFVLGSTPHSVQQRPIASLDVDPAIRVVDIDRAGVVTRMIGQPLDARDAAALANVRGPATVRFIPDPDRPSQLVAIVRYQRR